MDTVYRILVVNVGSTSVKLAVFENGECLHETQGDYEGGSRRDACGAIVRRIEEFLSAVNCPVERLAAVSSRSGILKPVPGGTYSIDEDLLADVVDGRYGNHASNLSPQAAHEFGRRLGIPCYVVDPITTDELEKAVRMTGIPSIERRSLFHSLSQKAAARKAAGELGINYEEGSFIVSHMGGGISVGAHRRGRVIDVGDAIGGDGPMAPERAGSIPGTQLARLCFDGSYSLEEVLRMFAGGGGVYAHLGTRDMKEVDHRAEQGDEYAALVREALACSVARAIGARAAMLCGQIDCTVFTGGLSQWDRLVRKITEKIAFLAPVKVYTENLEMEALATGVLRVLNGTEEPLRYASSG